MTNKPAFRTFETGASRDLDENKLDFEAFLSPLVIEKYGEYMHRKRQMADGSLRDGDNWQKGIPLDAYMKSSMRHQMDLWKHHRGYPDLTHETLVDTLCAQMFNIMGYLHEVLKADRAEALVDASGFAEVAEPAERPWIDWPGGEMPVARGTFVDVRYRDGGEALGIPAGEHMVIGPRCATFWGRSSCSSDIVAYRLSE